MDTVHPHLVEDRNGQQRGEGEGGGGHTMHGLAGGGDGREEPARRRSDDATKAVFHEHALGRPACNGGCTGTALETPPSRPAASAPRAVQAAPCPGHHGDEEHAAVAP